MRVQSSSQAAAWWRNRDALRLTPPQATCAKTTIASHSSIESMSFVRVEHGTGAEQRPGTTDFQVGHAPFVTTLLILH
jgi:hypothetical protein